VSFRLQRPGRLEFQSRSRLRFRTFTIGGTVTGLVGTGLVLQDNAIDSLTVSANGSYLQDRYRERSAV